MDCDCMIVLMYEYHKTFNFYFGNRTCSSCVRETKHCRCFLVLIDKNMDNEYVNFHQIISPQKYRSASRTQLLHVYNPNDKSLDPKKNSLYLSFVLVQISNFDLWDCSHR